MNDGTSTWEALLSRLEEERVPAFTEQVRSVLSRAQEEARSFQHASLGTEHILLGLLAEADGIAARVLATFGIELSKTRDTVEFIVGRGDRTESSTIGLTARAKSVIGQAVDEARQMHHRSIGTEHLLLSLVREGEGIATGVLESLGVNLETVRTQTREALTGYPIVR
jgi:ATP-dependent Clp protease ATP-binding subunit ClpC